MIRGNRNRSVGVTNLNEQSSRSHMIVTMTVFSTQLVNGNARVEIYFPAGSSQSRAKRSE